ncbi:MAG: hypothetical protein JW821_04140, partial [Deltaproteobacteria bacterium]|nr:hypothetical protein [Deltaproteobacteria bacterium]
LVLQGGSGLFLSLGGLPFCQDHDGGQGREQGPSFWHQGMEFLHRGGFGIGALYRVGIGLGLLWMALSGSTILFKIRARKRGRGGRT